jgi:hypothetical protein
MVKQRAAEDSNSKRAHESIGAGKPLVSPSPALPPAPSELGDGERLPAAPAALPSSAPRVLLHPNASASLTNGGDEREGEQWLRLNGTDSRVARRGSPRP